MYPILLLLALPQARPPSFPASDFLPRARTLACIELAAPDKLLARKAEIFQLQLFTAPGLSAIPRWFVERSWGRFLLENRRELGEILASFDRGLTLAWLFGEGGDIQGGCLVGEGSRSRRRHSSLLLSILKRELHPDLERITARDPTRLRVERTPLADSPVQAHLLQLGEEEQRSGWRSWREMGFFGCAWRRRKAAFFSQSWKNGRSRGLALQNLADLLGMGSKDRGGGEFGPPLALEEGEEILGRLVLRTDTFIRDEKYTSKRQLEHFKALGTEGLLGIQGFLVHGREGMRERYEIHDRKQESSFVHLFGKTGPGLLGAAEYLREDTLLALSLKPEAGRLTEAYYRFCLANHVPNPGKGVKIARTLLGLGEQEGEGRPGFEGLYEVCFFVVPPAAGSPIPEMGLLLRKDPVKGEERALLLRIAKHLIEGMGSPADPEKVVRTYGRGAKLVHTFSMKKLLAVEGGMAESMATRLLGGGYVSARRVGPWLALGCNPKSLRRLLEHHAQGRVLARRPSFRSLLEGSSGSLLQAWADLPGFVRHSGFLKSFLLPVFLFIGTGPGGETTGIPLLHFPSLEKALAEEAFVLEAADFGLLLRHRGGTGLSPLAWWVAGAAYEGFSVLSELAR